MATLLSIEGIHKTFEAGTVNENHVLKGLDLQVEEGISFRSSVEMELENQP